MQVAGGGYWGSLVIVQPDTYCMVDTSPLECQGGKVTNQYRNRNRVWGNLMGADIHEVYGIYAKENATYSNGLVIKTTWMCTCRKTGPKPKRFFTQTFQRM
ncbi:MAG: hypothetical protein IPH84_05920 [Bacteroidales bacterium]|nr:hypothetical protein [Bacteroidales bacterium]